MLIRFVVIREGVFDRIGDTEAAEFVKHRQDDFYTFEVNPAALGQKLDKLEFFDVVLGVAAALGLGAVRHNQAVFLVNTKGTGVQGQNLGGHAEGKDRFIGVDPGRSGPVGPAQAGRSPVDPAWGRRQARSSCPYAFIIVGFGQSQPGQHSRSRPTTRRATPGRFRPPINQGRRLGEVYYFHLLITLFHFSVFHFGPIQYMRV